MTALGSPPRVQPSALPGVRPRQKRRGIRRMRGPKHDLWVVPYADMMTLLFALFVVLYALGEVKLSKLTELRRSMAFAFHAGDDSGGFSQEGEFERSEGSGELVDAPELINAQWGAMERFLHESLVDEFKKVSGKMLEIAVTEDSMTVTAPLDSFYAADGLSPQEDVQRWVVELFDGIWDYAAEVRVRIDVPDVITARDLSGMPVRAEELCARRLGRMRELLRLIPAVDPRQVISELRVTPPVDGDWQRAGRITFSFSNP